MARVALLALLALLLPPMLLARGAALPSGPLDDSDRAMRPFVERWSADRASLDRRYGVPMSPAGRERRRAFLATWAEALHEVDFETLSRDGKIDWLLLRNRMSYEARKLELEAKRDREVEPLLPFWKTIVELAESKHRGGEVVPRQAADTLDALQKTVEATTAEVRGGKLSAAPPIAERALGRLRSLRRSLGRWHGFYDGYDPQFSWWTRKPYAAVTKALDGLSGEIRKRLVAGKGGPTGVGDPIGREGLLAELAREMIPYTPEELIDIAKKELAWCEAEMARAAAELGHDDWKKAQEHVKTLHVEPGDQPRLIRELAEEAVAFVTEKDLVSVPPLCREIWRMSMLSPERQRMSPYFLGGETVQVAFPTDTMSHRDKLMSLRGNNRHFVRAVVHHELIPGHHLQGFMTARYRTHRRPFGTAFWTEGWALWWEMLLWDQGFASTPEDRIGMLFWRKHRCARIVFSLSFHLGKMSPAEAVEFLVDRVGHEKNNATAEVRRSVGGGYGPLYQAAYMLGGLQLRALHRELVGSGKMTNREFHDAVLRENSMPIELIRADLTGGKLTKEFKTAWRFYGG